MRAYELPALVTSEGQITLPKKIPRELPPGRVVRLIVLVQEPEDVATEGGWERPTAEEFLAGYGEEDSIYDRV
ncbi:MAG: hypothetical protein ACRDJE_21165 [Dehalococcoidia bacterium]